MQVQNRQFLTQLSPRLSSLAFVKIGTAIALALLLTMLAALCDAREVRGGSAASASRRQVHVNADDELDDEGEAVSSQAAASIGSVPWPAFMSVVEEDSEEDDDKVTRVESKEILATPGQIVAFVICGMALVAACLLCFAADTVCCVCDLLCGRSRKAARLKNTDDISVLSQSPRAAEAPANEKASQETSASASTRIDNADCSRHAEPTEVLIHAPIPS